MTTSDKKGKPQTAKAKYVVVWGKQADGTWKALADVRTPDAVSVACSVTAVLKLA